MLHGQEQLRQLVEDTWTELSRVPTLRAGELSPRGQPRGQAATEVKSKLPPWAVVAAAVVIGALLYVGASFYMSGLASDASGDLERMTPVVVVR
jgi:type VI secretion system protein ImpK